jgi:hypothetical protein
MKRFLLRLTLVLFTAPFATAQDLPSNIPTDGLAAYYSFNGNANDESGNGNHGNNAVEHRGVKSNNFGQDLAIS